MQICSVISEWRAPGKQDCRTLWLDVPERSGGEPSSFVSGLPAQSFSGFTLYADS